MALTLDRTPAGRFGLGHDDVEERDRTADHASWNIAVRVVATVAAAVPVAWSLVAMVRLDRDVGLDAVPVEVWGLAFTPAAAIATLAIGLIALAAAVADDRASKLAIGALLACIGVAGLLAGTALADLDLEAGHAWLALALGLVLIAAGVAMDVPHDARRALEERTHPEITS